MKDKPLKDHKEKILVVDDDYTITEALNLILTEAGYRVLTAQNVAESTAILSQTPIDLVLTDLCLPDGTGIDVITHIKNETFETEVILMTAHGSVDITIEAIKRVLKNTGLTIGDIDLFEINEAFSAVSLAINRELGLDPKKVNVNGGAVALGHPIGATGARILTTLLHAMEARGARRGLASLCIGGGEALAVIVER